MTEKISNDTLDNFQRLTSYDIRTFFQSYLSFIDVDYSNITNFYTAASNVVPTGSFNNLASLIEEQKKIIDVTILNAPSLNEYTYWALLEYVEDIGHVLETADNASKWLRSSITKTGYKQQVQMDLMADQGEGLESIERNKLRSTTFNDSWVQTALDNQLREEDYTLDGGYLIKAIFKNNSSIFLNGIVDNIDSPLKTYGLDIDRNLKIVDSDLAVLSYQDTILQCAEILTGLKKEDDPTFRDRGTNPKLIGSNVAGISYPSIFRDLAANFATDDSFKSFGITKLRREQDAIYIDFKVTTKAGESFDSSKQIA